MLRKLKEDELDVVRRWRNEPDVRRVMFTDHVISPEEHRKWWSNVKHDPTKEVLLFLDQGQAIGVVNFFDIDSGMRSCHWGFYLADSATMGDRNKVAAWLELEQEAVAYAFDTLGCESLHCETFSHNAAALQMHKRFGFRRTGVQRRERDGVGEDVILMTLDRPQQEASSAGPSFAFIGSANWDLAGRALKKTWSQFTDAECEVVNLPFGQYRSELTNPDSVLYRSRPDYLVMAERFEDFFPSPFDCFDTSLIPAVEDRFQEYLGAIRSARERLDGVLLVLDLVPTRPVADTLNDNACNPDSVAAFVARLNEQLLTLCDTLSDCLLVSLSSVVHEVGSGLSNAGKYWYLARLGISDKAMDALARRLAATVLSRTGRTARVVVVDLDNTLWGGVVGDDGIAGLQLGGDFPGNAFSAIQHALKALTRRGIALAICSKNTEAVALDALRRHPGMVLEESDFVASCINWEDKGDNIRSIAEEISLGLGSVFVLDDSPYERDAIRAALPQAIVPDPPEDITEWPGFLINHPCLASLSLTEEDKVRVQRYHARQQVAAEEGRFANRDEYLHNMNMQLGFDPLADTNRHRILQLIAKTNQFNMTTRRYGESQINDLLHRGATIIGVALSDKYSARETIGALILLPEDERTLVIDTFLLSCRVLGRTVESAILAWAAIFATQRGFKSLRGEVIATDRNGPAQGVYSGLGFTQQGPGEYVLDLSEELISIPPWFEIFDEVTA